MRLALRRLGLSLAAMVVMATLLAGCDADIEFELSPEPEPIGFGPDPHSFANYDQVTVEHLSLDLATDFSRQILAGHATLSLSFKDASIESSQRRLVLDTWQLDIRDVNRVERDGTLEPLSWQLGEIPQYDEGEPREYLGQPLIIALPAGVDQVRIDYATSPEAFGLQWLDEQQTSSGQPFLYSQSQPIYARSWVPLQDTPAVRYTFDARLRVPQHLLAVMGAGGNPTEKNLAGEYRFEMPQPIPSYLMAIAVGELKFQSTGPRSGVYAEPSQLEAASDEFSELERMIDIGESLYGDYRWDRYDLLILPPSFPFGGMENPRLSFITPTVIAGDKSLTDLIAHELAHSWSGNLVTNASWRELWLNEGFTVYFEARIMEALYGTERRNMQAKLDYFGLLAELRELKNEDQLLARDLSNKDPETAFIGIPYDKGRLFVEWLDARYGRERFDEFLRAYFDHFAFQSISTEQFIDYLERELMQANPGLATMDEVQEWIYEPGLPAFAITPESDAFDIVDNWRERWLNGEIELDAIPSNDWSVAEWRQFLLELSSRLSLEQMAELDAAFDLTGSGNTEILYLWLMRSIETRYEPGIERLEQFLLEVGRNKFIRPLYQKLAETDWGHNWAIEIYQRAKPGYHPLTRQAAERVLQLNESSAAEE